MMRFFKENSDKIIQNVPYTSDDCYYKFYWSFTKAEVLNDFTRDQFVNAFIKNHVDFKNKYFIRSMILMTKTCKTDSLTKVYNAVGKLLIWMF